MIETGTLATVCSNCPSEQMVASLTAAIETNLAPELGRYIDQIETSFSDVFHSEVNYRPAAQQWAVCTP